ncbi:amidase domain-containing protein [Clostridium sp. SHJSY1]|nr:amidase domain-containing protein [Clostridium sp. SHJSY1]
MYANKYAKNPNSQYYNYIDEGGDCTNFISQCLYAGGLGYTETWSPTSDTWRTAILFRYYLMSFDYHYREYTVGDAIDNWDIIYFQIHPGDVIQYGTSPYNTTHSQIVTSYSSKDSSVYIAQHSDNMPGFYNDKNLLNYLHGRSKDDIMYIHQIKKYN